MRVEDLIQKAEDYKELEILKERCSSFIQQSGGLPLLKNLSSRYGDFHKVKIRKRKAENNIDEMFDGAFNEEHHELRKRALFAYGQTSFEPLDEEIDKQEPFYIFPIDGYKFMYSQEVENSNEDYQQVFEIVIDHFGEQKGQEVLTDLLKFTYCHENLEHGISSGAEILIYNIPFFYAIRATTVEDYNELLTAIRDLD